MTSLEFTTEEIQTLHHVRFHHPHPRVQGKVEALYLHATRARCNNPALTLPVVSFLRQGPLARV